MDVRRIKEETLSKDGPAKEEQADARQGSTEIRDGFLFLLRQDCLWQQVRDNTYQQQLVSWGKW